MPPANVFLYYEGQLAQLPEPITSAYIKAIGSCPSFLFDFPLFFDSAAPLMQRYKTYLLDEVTYKKMLDMGVIWQTGRELIIHHPFSTSYTSNFQPTAKALQLAQWLKTVKYCIACGTKYNFFEIKQPLQEIKCACCDHIAYPVTAPCVIGLITKGNQLLLARHVRSQQPIYSLIAGFVDPGENIEQAFQREAKEECNIEIYLPRYLASQPWPFPGQLMIGLQAEHKAGEIKPDLTELIDAQFFSVDHLPLLPPAGTISRYLIDRFCAEVRNSRS